MRGAEPETQALQALIALLSGMASAFCYELLISLFRKLQNPFVQAAADILFGCGCSLLLFLMGLVVGEGELRLFMPLILLLGALGYFLLLRKPGRYLASLFRSFVSLLLFPSALLLRLGKFFLIFQKNLFHYLVRWFTIRQQAMVSLQGIHKESTYGAETRQHYDADDRSRSVGLYHSVRDPNQRENRRGSTGKSRA